MRSPCLSSLTEKNEKRAIFALSSLRLKFFHYTWKLCIRGSVTSASRCLTTDKIALDAGSQWMLTRANKPIAEVTLHIEKWKAAVWQQRVRGKSYNRGLWNISRELMPHDTLSSIPTRRVAAIFQHRSWIFTSPNGTSTTRGVFSSLCR